MIRQLVEEAKTFARNLRMTNNVFEAEWFERCAATLEATEKRALKAEVELVRLLIG